MARSYPVAIRLRSGDISTWRADAVVVLERRCGRTKKATQYPERAALKGLAEGFGEGFGKMTRLAIVLMFCCGCQTPRYIHGIPNFAMVEPGLYRGGQPNNEGWKYLAWAGVRADIKLNTDAEAKDSFAEQCGMSVFKRPISLEQQLGVEQLWQASLEATVSDAFGGSYNHSKSGDGVFIHCQHGEDRTGLIVAIYRVRVLGWKKREAEAEMMAHGFHKELLGLWEAWEAVMEK